MLDSLVRFSKYMKSRHATNTNLTFRLGKFNFAFFMCLVAIFSAKTYFSDPIDCTIETSRIPKSHVDSFCWLMGTYTRQGFIGTISDNSTEFGFGQPQPQAPKTYQRYYQWMVFVYFFMGLSYILPLFLWKSWEGGLMCRLCNDLHSPLHEKYWTKETRDHVLAYFVHARRGTKHQKYAFCYFVCQLLNLAICIGNILVVEVMFDGFWERFYPAITALIPFDYNKWTVTTAELFPRMAQCEYFNIGSSGSTQRYDLLCLMPLNIINEKVFAFLFFWLIVVTALAALDVFSGILVMSSHYIRVRKLADLMYDGNLDVVNRASNYAARGEFFVLYLFGKNVTPYVFNDLMVQLSKTQRFKMLPEAEV